MPILDHRQPLEQIAPLGIGLGRGQPAIQERGVPLVAVVLVPGRVGVGRSCVAVVISSIVGGAVGPNGGLCGAESVCARLNRAYEPGANG